MTGFILGTAASLFAIFIVWLSKEHIIPELKRRLFAGTPYVAGTYDLIKMSYHNHEEIDDESSVKKVRLKQSGTKVWGEITYGGKRFKSKLRGYISGSRILTFTFEPENKNIHDYGTAMLKLCFEGQAFKGIVTFLCGCCEDITPTHVIMKKKDIE